MAKKRFLLLAFACLYLSLVFFLTSTLYWVGLGSDVIETLFSASLLEKLLLSLLSIGLFGLIIFQKIKKIAVVIIVLLFAFQTRGVYDSGRDAVIYRYTMGWVITKITVDVTEPVELTQSGGVLKKMTLQNQNLRGKNESLSFYDLACPFCLTSQKGFADGYISVSEFYSLDENEQTYRN